MVVVSVCNCSCVQVSERHFLRSHARSSAGGQGTLHILLAQAAQAPAGEVKLSVRDLLALVATFGDLVRAASLRALKTRADTLAALSGVFTDAGTGAFALVAFSFITCMHAMALPGGVMSRQTIGGLEAKLRMHRPN